MRASMSSAMQGCNCSSGAEELQEQRNRAVDHVYYNATFTNQSFSPNGTDEPIAAMYQEVRSDPLISIPEDWYISVIRFKIPTNNIPLFHFENVTFTANAQVTMGSDQIIQFPQLLTLTGTFSAGSPTITNVYLTSATGGPSVSDCLGLRVGPLTNIRLANNSGSITMGVAPSGLIPIVPPTYIAAVGFNTITMSANAVFPATGPQIGTFQFVVDTATGYNQAPIPLLTSLASNANGAGAVVSGTGIPAGTEFVSGDISVMTISNNATITNLFPPGTPVSVVSSPYSVTLFYLGDYYSQILIPTTTVASDGYNVFAVQEFIESTNNAFLTTFTELKAAHPGFPGSHPPFIYFDPLSGLFGIVAESGAWQPNNPTGGIIYLSPVLQGFFNNFNIGPLIEPYGYPVNIEVLGANSRYPSGNLFTVAIGADPYGNIATYAALDQLEQTSSLCYWNHAEKLLITTGTLPIQYEYLANTPAGIDGAVQVGSSSNFQAVLVDFVLSEIGLDRCEVVYNANPYRLVDLRGTTPISTIDLQLYWQDRFLVNHPILISPNDYAEVKFLFRKKFLAV